MRQESPDFFRDKRHERVQQAEELVQDIDQDLLGGALGGFVFAIEAGFCQLNVPVAVGIPDEIVKLRGGDAQLVAVEIFGDVAN